MRPPILKKLKDKLIEIQSDPATLPKSPITQAVNCALNECDALCNYILRHDYFPDNNGIERLFRHISLSRKNSLFFGSHAGAGGLNKHRSFTQVEMLLKCLLHLLRMPISFAPDAYFI